MVILNLRKRLGKKMLGCVAAVRKGRRKKVFGAGENANSALVSAEEAKPLPPSTSPRRKHLPLMIMLRKKPVSSAYFLASGYFTVML